MSQLAFTLTPKWTSYKQINFTIPVKWNTPSRHHVLTIAGEDVFDYVVLDWLHPKNTYLYWRLKPKAQVKPPILFEVQISYSGNPHDESTWKTIATLQDTYYYVDKIWRWTGKVEDVLYRIKLTDSTGRKATSQPAIAWIKASFRERHLWRELFRKEWLRMRFFTASEGWLLQRIRDGVPCPRCADKYTKEAKDSHCHVCYGTGIENGYYPPWPSVYAELTPAEYQEDRSEQHGFGTHAQRVIQARTLPFPPMRSQDVWVSSHGICYTIRLVKHEVVIRGLPAMQIVSMTQLPPHDIIYSYPIP